jgi:hypothetical protein
MILTKLLKAKKFFTKPNGDRIIDLISATFSFEKIDGYSQGFVRVQEEEAMRPDLISVRLYANQNYYETLLKYNGISNPFSLAPNDILLTPPFKSLETSIVPPKNILEKGEEKVASNETKLLDPKTVKDKKRLQALKDKVKEIVPPNVNTEGNRNIKVRDGRVIFGEDVTQVNAENSSTSTSRARVIQRLTQSNSF